MNDILIAPSLLAGDFARMGEEARRMERAGADWLHLDVMDGHFVPAITFGAQAAASLRPCTGLFFDVHLMVEHPERCLDNFPMADMITMHIETIDGDSLEQAIRTIRAMGKQAALSVKPGTPIEAVFPWLDHLDMVLVMTVEPGYGGQSFMPGMLPKIKTLREEAARRTLNLRIQVDGGISEATIGRAYRAGADCFVAGSAVFGAEDAAKAIEDLRQKAKETVSSQSPRTHSPPGNASARGGP